MQFFLFLSFNKLPFSTAGEGLYQLLGLEKEATPAEIKKAYRKVFKKNYFRVSSNNSTIIFLSIIFVL